MDVILHRFSGAEAIGHDRDRDRDRDMNKVLELKGMFMYECIALYLSRHHYDMEVVL